MRKHLVLTAVGLATGLVMLAWVQPDTSSGAVFLVIAVLIAVNAVGAVFGGVSAGRRRSASRNGKS